MNYFILYRFGEHLKTYKKHALENHRYNHFEKYIQKTSAKRKNNYHQHLLLCT